MSIVLDRNQEATVYVGNLDERCTEALIWELMLQVGPVVNVHLPKDRVTQAHQGYGFCEFTTEEDADYCIKIMNLIKLFGKPIRVNKATADKKSLEVGANLFVGNLDPSVDEKILYDTFSAFGTLVLPPKVGRDLESGSSKGFAFVSYDNFDSSDAAIDAMNGQYLANKAVTVVYALKKDGKGERHGSAAERLLAAQARKNNPEVMSGRLTAEMRMRAGIMPTGNVPPNFPPQNHQGGYAPPPPPSNGYMPPPQNDYYNHPPPPPPAGYY